jgi:hypothetical protein
MRGKRQELLSRRDDINKAIAAHKANGGSNRLFDMQIMAALAMESFQGGMTADEVRRYMEGYLENQKVSDADRQALTRLSSTAEAEAFHNEAVAAYEQYDNARDALHRDLEAVNTELHHMRDASDKVIHAAMEVRDATKPDPTLLRATGVRLNKDHVASMTWLSRVANPKSLTYTARIERTDKAASSHIGDKVSLSYGADAGTLVHEMGHHLHDWIAEPLVTAAVNEFFDRRTKASPLQPYNGRSDVKVKADNFMDAYTGRVYGWEKSQRGLEVVSCGLEKMYRCPSRFREADPEHFELIADILAATHAVTASR